MFFNLGLSGFFLIIRFRLGTLGRQTTEGCCVLLGGLHHEAHGADLSHFSPSFNCCIQLVSARLLHYEVTIFPLAINVREILWDHVNVLFLFVLSPTPLPPASIEDPCLKQSSCGCQWVVFFFFISSFTSVFISCNLDVTFPSMSSLSRSDQFKENIIWGLVFHLVTYLVWSLRH